MGPPLFRGGHARVQLSARRVGGLQWGHLSLEVVIFRTAIGLLGTSRLQWGHLSLEVVMPPASVLCPRVHASMGPPLFRGGHDVQPTHDVLDEPGFNGATSL